MKDGSVHVFRNYDKANPKPEILLDYSFKRGTTGTSKTNVFLLLLWSYS